MRRSSLTLAGLLGLALLVGLALPAGAATDPDGDPAQPLTISTWVEALDLQVLDAEAYLQTSSNGLDYLRIDLTLENTGSTAIHAVDWDVQAGAVATTISPNMLIDPGEQVTVTELVFGTSVSALGSGTTVSVGLTQSLANSDVLCSQVPSQSQCEQFKAASQAMCWSSCVAKGGHGGSVQCIPRTHKDRNGLTCTIWVALCLCDGRPSLTEGLDEGLFDPFDPRAQDVVTYPPLVESRPHHP